MRLNRIFFEDLGHRYYDEKKTPYISVSQLAHKLEPEKDWDAIKEKYAKKNGLTIEEVTKDWEHKRVWGTQVGTKLHDIREKEVLAKKTILYKKKEHTVVPSKYIQKKKVCYDLSNLSDMACYPELILYNHDYRLAGQTDKLFITKGKAFVYDYKTDKEITKRAFQTATIPPDMLKHPVSHLEDCNFNMYSIKMSLYMWMLLKANPKLKPGGIILQHCQLERDMNNLAVLDKEGNPKVKQEKDYEIPYLKKEVEDILKIWKPQVSAN